MIGIYANMTTSGGSEMRAATLATAWSRFIGPCHLLAAGKINDRIRPHIGDMVTVFEDALQHPEAFNGLSQLVVIMSDNRAITTAEYWAGIDLKQIKTLVFLSNFLVSPTIQLPSLNHRDVRIAVTNRRFLNEVSTQDRYLPVRHYPRTLLLSPIDPNKITTWKEPSQKIRLGRHSKPYKTKWNPEIIKVVKQVNETHADRVAWDFMGIDESGRGELESFPNVTIRQEYSIPVMDYLKGIDVCVYMPRWGHQEPWARSTAEAMASGCPLITTDADGGNRDQVLHGNNGFLCKDADAFVRSIRMLVDNPDILKAMSSNCILYANRYTPEKVVNDLKDFMW